MTTALVLGGAATLWDDVEAALELGEFDAVVTCNDATAAWPGPIDAAATYHAEKWPMWLERRRRKGLPRPARLFGHAEFSRSILSHKSVGDVEYVQPRFEGQTDTGSSGLFALKVALIDLGHDKAVACGMPLDRRPHFFDLAVWQASSAHRRGWNQALPQLRDRARSMSGWTADLLGRPTTDWLAS